MTSALVLALLLSAPPLSFGARVDGARAVERARYAFVIGSPMPFDEAYPRPVFEKKVRREMAEENVLSRRFGMEVTAALLAAEYERIEKETVAPDQWEAVKKALAGSRRTIEEVVCRPLLVDRALRTRFAFDQGVHAAAHGEARAARERFLEGGAPSGAKLLRLSRRVAPAEGTGRMLTRAKADAAGPNVPAMPDTQQEKERPLVLDPEMVTVLEKELKAKGDVTTILEERDRFSVFRLVTSSADEWLVEGVQVFKSDFDRWLEGASGEAAPGVASPARTRTRGGGASARCTPSP